MYTGDLSYSNYNQGTVTWHRIPERAWLPHSLDLNGGLGFRVQGSTSTTLGSRH